MNLKINKRILRIYVMRQTDGKVSRIEKRQQYTIEKLLSFAMLSVKVIGFHGSKVHSFPNVYYSLPTKTTITVV